MEVVCIGIIALAMLTLLGHGIWIVTSAIFRTVFGSDPPARVCPRCRSERRGDARECVWCGWPGPPGAASKRSAALSAAELELDYLLNAQALDPATHARLRAAIQAERVSAAVAPQAVQPATAGTEAPVMAEIVSLPIETPPLESTLPIPKVDAPSLPDPYELALSVAERAQTFAERQQQAPPLPPPPQTPPKRPLSQLLVAFLEEKNIRWGELIGGLLIVGCSIALVISFWAQIAERPFLKFFLFNGVTASLFGVGLYIHRRWKLPTTSFGVLIIASLLVPLNFLALAAFTAGPAASAPATLIGEVISIALFSMLLLLAGRVIAAPWPWLLAVGVIVPSALSLLVRRIVTPHSGVTVWLVVGSLPVLAYLANSGAMIFRARRWEQFDTPAAEAIFRLLGASTFAAAVPCGLLLARTGERGRALHELSWLVTLFSAPALANGLLIWKRAADAKLSGIRTAGTSIAVLGVMVLLGSIGLSWPEPAGMVPAAVVGFVMLSAIALLFEIPAAHLLAVACLAVAYIVGFHAARSAIAWNNADPALLARALFSAASGSALIPLVAMLGAVVAVAGRLHRPQHARFIALAAGAIAVVSIVLVTWHGFGRAGDLSGATWVYLVYAVAAVIAAGWTGRTAIGWVGCGLVLTAVVQGVVYRWGGAWNLAQPMLAAALVFGSVTAMGQLLLSILVSRDAAEIQEGSVTSNIQRSLGDPLWISAFAAAAVSTAYLLWLLPTELPGRMAVHTFWLAAIWLGLALAQVSPGLFWVFQATASAAIAFTVASRLATHAWYQQARFPWLDPWSLQAHGMALAITGLLWLLLRGALCGRRNALESAVPVVTDLEVVRPANRRFDLPRRLLSPSGPAFDSVVAAVVLAGLIALSVYGVVPGAAQELSPRYPVSSQQFGPVAPPAAGVLPPRQVPPAANFELFSIPHDHALQVGSWVLLALILALLTAEAWTASAPWHVLGIFLALATAAPLLAGRFEGDVAAASALRWCLTGFVVIASIPVWFRNSVAARAHAIGFFPRLDERSEQTDFTGPLVLSLAFIPPLLMALIVGAAAVFRAEWTADVTSLYRALAVTAVAAGLVGLLLRQVPGIWPQQGTFVARSEGWLKQSGTLLMVLGIAPLLVITIYVASTSLAQNPILGPEPGTFFNRIGAAASYSLPVLVLGAVLVGYAIRERQSTFALGAGSLFHVGLTAAWLMTAAKSGLRLDAVLWIRLAHLNAIIACSYALAWIAAVAWWRRRTAAATEQRAERATDALLTTQLLVGVALQIMILVAAWMRLFLNPFPSPAVVQAASVWGWVSFALAVMAVGWLARQARVAMSAAGWATGLLAVASLAAFTASRWDALDWLGYHTLMAGHAIAPWLLLAVVLYPLRRDPAGAHPSRQFGLIAACGSIAVLLALRAVFGDPQTPWWSAGVLLAMSLLAVALAVTAIARGLLYAAGVLINLAASIWWIQEGWKLTGARFSGAQLIHFLDVNIIALTLPSLVWAWLELRLFRTHDRQRIILPGFHRLAASAALWTVAGLTVMGLLADGAQAPVVANPLLVWGAILSTAAAIVACLWDPAARLSVAYLYLLGLVAIGATLDQFNLSRDRLLWTGGMILAAYSVGTSYLWSRRGGLTEIATRLGMPRATDAPFAGLWWLVPANLLCATAVVIVAFWADLNLHESRFRLLMGMAAITQAVAVGMLARGTRRSGMQQVALLLGVIGAVAWGWAWLDPFGPSGAVLNRAVVAMTALAIMTVVYGLGPAKFLSPQNEWTGAARRLLPGLICLGAASMAFVFVVEVRQWLSLGGVQIAPWALTTVAATILLLVCAAIAAAILPGRDPLHLSPRARTVYVYAAEALLALLFVHFRVTMPWLFTGFFTRYWPFIVMLIAFLGVGLSELFRRQGRVILAEPLDRTGVLLPLLPVLGFWFVPSSAHYSLLLLAVGVLYAGLSVTRRSFGFGVLAALAANGGLWYFLNRVEGLGLLAHPQIWLIPPAVCVLCAAYLNRDRLSDAQMSVIRYLTATTIYVSSTADIFLIGVGEAPWLPLVLAGLSILGVLAGIVLRVRAFLFLGTSFLVLAIFTVIWYAAVDLDQTWLWWASGIVTGVLIIAVFAVFEKKRQEVLHVLEQLRQWQP